MNNNWISMRTKPPEPGEEVICCIVSTLPPKTNESREYREHRFIDTLIYIGEKCIGKDRIEHIFKFRSNVILINKNEYTVTHWMHLPRFPSNINVGDEVQYKSNSKDKFFVTHVDEQYCEGIYANGEVIEAASLKFLEKTGKTSPKLISFLKEETTNES